jgi:hypothetical protein
VAVKIFWDISRDPTSHNLWPFELILMALLGAIPAAGLAVGYTVRNWTRVPPNSAWIGAYMAAVLAAASPVLSRDIDARGESDTAGTLKRLWQAETTYAAADPKHRFTCEGSLLPGFEHETWLPVRQGLPARNWMHRGRYAYKIACDELSGGDRLYILADPRQSPTGGNLFCVDQTGTVHSAPANNRAVCGSGPPTPQIR